MIYGIRRSCVLLGLALLLGTGSPLQLAADEASAVRSDAEIESLLAPIALYPDTLLTQVLIAATYPLEVVAAARWVRANPGVEGADAVAATEAHGWDPSVQALTAFPEILERMDADLDWTQTLGEVFLAQEDALMAAVQTLRRRAQAAGTLERPEYLRLDDDGDAISLRPPRDELVYIPWYDTRQAYGSWPSSRHPPIYWDPIAWHHSGRGVRSPFLWGPAILLDPLYYPTRIDWHRRGVVVVHRGHPGRGEPPRWKHETKHRRGVRYRHPDAESRYAERQWHGTRRGHPGHRDRRSDRDRHSDRSPPSPPWPEQPTASLSQQRAGAIDTRTATERLRAMQAEGARASARSESTRRSHRTPRRAEQQTAAPARRPMQQPAATPSRPPAAAPASPVMRPANTPPPVRTQPAQRSPDVRAGVRSARPDAGARNRAARSANPRPEQSPH